MVSEVFYSVYVLLVATRFRSWPHIVMAFIVTAYIVRSFLVMAYVVTVYKVMVYIVKAYIVIWPL